MCNSSNNNNNNIIPNYKKQVGSKLHSHYYYIQSCNTLGGEEAVKEEYKKNCTSDVLSFALEV